ncbi:hypothetical protein PR001_g4272 [Phytophthora rubi]|uniref:Uncharacterized protein n=1 Tax=Phytophthora rubi TaxID=129364 RepID=A0A6A3P2E1_9STRA|nr:hypothetical protein PR001_g4272 [Phytophthora rubi]
MKKTKLSLGVSWGFRGREKTRSSTAADGLPLVTCSPLVTDANLLDHRLAQVMSSTADALVGAVLPFMGDADNQRQERHGAEDDDDDAAAGGVQDGA